MPTFFTKKVRFAYKNSFFSPPPPTPALSFSSSLTPSDSEKLITPQFLTQSLPGPTLYTTTYVPAKVPPKYKYNEPIRAHPLLEVGAIKWNLLDHPSAIKYNDWRISRLVLSEPATLPPRALLRINSPHLPWIIKVYASNGSFVTLEDLFYAVYNSLRRNITPSDFSSLPSPNDQMRATRAYEKRYREKRTTKEYEAEKMGGMKRVDFLMRHTRFVGISNNSGRPDEWQLLIS